MALGCLALGCLAFSASALAGASDILASNNQARLQFVSTYVNYVETGNGIFGTSTGTLDTETGLVPGAALSVSVMTGSGNIYLEAGYDYSSLYTSYTGSLQGGPFGSVTSTSGALLINYYARIGKGFAVGDAFMLTPYAEFGSHEWRRGINYGEIYSHDYCGLGVLGQYSPSGASRLVLSAGAMLASLQEPYILAKSGSGTKGFSGELGGSVLTRFGAAADYAFTERLHGNVSVDYTTFSYGMSAVYPVGGGTVVWEPASKTYYATVKLGLGLAF